MLSFTQAQRTRRRDELLHVDDTDLVVDTPGYFEGCATRIGSLSCGQASHRPRPDSNPTVGDLDGNVAKIVAAYDQAEAAGCDIVAFPELAITGYPPEDLVLKPGFVADNLRRARQGGRPHRRCAAVVGFVDADRDLYNAAAVCANGEVLGTYRKRLLPNYAVFDEARYFTPGDDERSARAVRDRRRQGRHQHLRGHLEPRPARSPRRPPAAPS